MELLHHRTKTAWLHVELTLLAGAGDEQTRCFCFQINRQLAIATRSEPRRREPFGNLVGVESLPDVAELHDVFGSIVRHEIDNEHSSTGLEHTLDFPHRSRGIADEM